METKALFAICLQIALLKYTSSQCIGKMLPEPISATGMNVFTSQLTMQNVPLPAPSFYVFSDGLAVEGIVGVTGTLPFLGTVSLEGILPTAGEGTVMFNTGDGGVGITSEMPFNGMANMYSVRY